MRSDGIPSRAVHLADFYVTDDGPEVHVYGVHEQDDSRSEEHEFTYYELYQAGVRLNDEPLSQFPSFQQAAQLLARR